MLPVAILSTGVSAFFPYKSKTQASSGDNEGKINGRFFPWPLDDGLASDGDGGGKQPLTLSVGKVETGQVG